MAAHRGIGSVEIAVTKFGVHLGLGESTLTELREAWEALDESEFEWMSVSERVQAAASPPRPDGGGGQLEAVACLGAMAVATLRARLGCMVFSAGDRHPATLAQAGATIDRLSAGRLELGIGAGRASGRGAATPAGDREAGDSEAVRLRRLAECVQVVRLLWTQELADFDGEFFRLTGAPCRPKPIQQPPRIWVGTAGGHGALELAGRLGDGWNAAFIGPDEFARKMPVVKEAAPDPGRLVTSVILGFLPVAGEDLGVSLGWRQGVGGEPRPGVITGSTNAMLDAVSRYVAGGADWVIFAPLVALDAEVVDTLIAFGRDALLEFG
jgi:alkanesulfonate monooxygenase SsuD/methylene tetrahydromethanopterin reductase-like flavin-dependent oxidoreductase (luciferase family)